MAEHSRRAVVLVGEDTATHYELLSDYLADCGYSVYGASTGPEALELARELHPEVLLIDYNLPGLSGCEVTLKLKHDPDTRRVAVAMMTGDLRESTRLQARAAGCDGFLSKPFRLEAVSQEVARLVALGQRTRRLLLVEDDLDARQALSQLLSDQGFEVAQAADGRAALQRLQEEPAPDLILLDLMMPGLNGWQFLEERRRDQRLAAIPVVVVTAARPLRVDADALLHKPIDVRRLLRTIESVSL